MEIVIGPDVVEPEFVSVKVLNEVEPVTTDVVIPVATRRAVGG